MKILRCFHLPAFAGFALAVAATPAFAEGPYRNRDNKNALKDSAEGTYPIPYQLPTVAEVTESLARIRDRKSTRLNSSHAELSRMPSSA